MARSHGRILSSIWLDDDFTALSYGAQRMYLFLISQPKLSLAGVLDYMPRRWARAANDLTEDDIEHAVVELERARFVLVDRDTDEVLVRSFVRHDGVASSWPLTRAMWSAWQTIQSRPLADAVLLELPDEAWSYDRAPAPEGATKPTRNTSGHPPDTPTQAPCEAPSEGPCQGASDGACEAPTEGAVARKTPSPSPSPGPNPILRRHADSTTHPPPSVRLVAVAAEAAPAKRSDHAFDALCAVTATDPAALTKAGRGALNAALGDIRRSWANTGEPPDALPDEIRTRARRYATRFTAVLTPSALAKHWAGLTERSEVLQSPAVRRQAQRASDHQAQLERLRKLPG